MWKEPTGTWCGGGIQIPNPAPGQYPRFDNDEWSGVDKNTLRADLATVLQVGDVAGAESTANKGQANGYPSLDGAGKIPTAQLPETVVGAVDYKGTWNAATNTPNLGGLSPEKGDYYLVSVAGATSLGGITDWKVGDWAIFDGSIWAKVDHTPSVTSVAGRVGDVTLSVTDVSGAASLNGSNKVVEDPANATTTPTAGKIPLANGSGKLDDWVSPVATYAPGLMTAADKQRLDSLSYGTTSSVGVVPSSLGSNQEGLSPTQSASAVHGVTATGGGSDTSLSDATLWLAAPSRPWHFGGLYSETHTAVDTPCGFGAFVDTPGYPVYILARVVGGGWQVWKDNGLPGSAIKDGSVINLPDRPWVRVVIPTPASEGTAVEWQGSTTGEPGSWTTIATRTFNAGPWTVVAAMPGSTITVHRWIAPTSGSDNVKVDLPIADGGTGASTATAAFDNLAPTTTKGDIVVRGATQNVRLGVGTNSRALVADSSTSTGLAWQRLAPSLETRNWFGFRGSVGIGLGVTTVGAAAGPTNDSQDSYVLYSTAAEANSPAFLRTEYNVLRLAYSPELWVRVKTAASIASIRIWIGFTSTDSGLGSDAGSTHHAMLRYSSGADGTSWALSTSFNGIQNTSSASVTINPSTLYDIRLRTSGTTLYASINGGGEVSLSGAPTSSQDLGVFVGVYTTNSLAKAISIARGQVEFG